MIGGLDRFLSLWDREGITVWPRKAMGLFTYGQRLVKSKKELEDLVEESGGLDCFMQTHTADDRTAGIMYLIFIDIDCPGNLRRAEKIKDRVSLHIAKEYGLKPCVHFSGFKGYHILTPVKVAKLPPAKYPEFLKFCQLKLSLGYCDRQLLGDVVRLARIPGTYNSKAVEKGLEGQVHIIQEWNGKELDPGILWEEFKLHKLEEKLKGKTKTSITYAPEAGKIRPPVQALVETARQGANLSHDERLIILFEMIANGYTDSQIHEVFRFQPDYSERITQRFIDHARRRGYRPFKLQKILEALQKPSRKMGGS
jgi:hypothetical protein